jgi:hypothetical protein
MQTKVFSKVATCMLLPTEQSTGSFMLMPIHLCCRVQHINNTESVKTKLLDIFVKLAVRLYMFRPQWGHNQ